MFKGTCPKCGQKYYGWALQDEKHRICDHCGGRLRVTQESSVNKTKGGIKMDKTKEKKGGQEISGERTISRRKFIKKMAYAAPVVMTFIASKADADGITPCNPGPCEPRRPCRPHKPCPPGKPCPPNP